MKKIIILGLLLIAVIALTGCPDPGPQDYLIGTWRWEYGFTWEEIAFKSDGSFVESGEDMLGPYSESGVYVQTDTEIEMIYDFGFWVYTYTFGKDYTILILTDEQSFAKFYTRQ